MDNDNDDSSAASFTRMSTGTMEDFLDICDCVAVDVVVGGFLTLLGILTWENSSLRLSSNFNSRRHRKSSWACALRSGSGMASGEAITGFVLKRKNEDFLRLLAASLECAASESSCAFFA